MVSDVVSRAVKKMTGTSLPSARSVRQTSNPSLSGSLTPRTISSGSSAPAPAGTRGPADARTAGEPGLAGGQRAGGGRAAVLPDHRVAHDQPGPGRAVRRADHHLAAAHRLDRAALEGERVVARAAVEGDLAVHAAESTQPRQRPPDTRPRHGGRGAG